MSEASRHQIADRQNPVIVVSGVPRSGTSMVMKMLEAGGVPILTDHARTPDADNPKGYFELEKVKNLQKDTDKSWVREARGKCIKVISALLRELPSENEYRILFLERNLEEVIQSQNKMLQRRGEPVDPSKDGEMSRLFHQHLETLREWLGNQPNFSVLFLQHREILEDPLSGAEQIERFLELRLNREAMQKVVDPALYRNRIG